MTTQQVADQYYEMIKQGKQVQIQQELYSNDIVNREPEHAIAMGVPTLTKGLEAVQAKSKARNEMIEEVHSSFCTEPVVAGNFFTVAMGRDVTFKGKPRMSIAEIAVFEVKDGKIITEQFFF